MRSWSRRACGCWKSTSAFSTRGVSGARRRNGSSSGRSHGSPGRTSAASAKPCGSRTARGRRPAARVRLRRRARGPWRAGRCRRRLQRHLRAFAHSPRPDERGVGLLTARSGHRPGPRAQSGGRFGADALAAGAARARRCAALGSRARRAGRRMTFEEARALFPVLERVAYLNAGMFGPLARATADAVAEQLRRDVKQGRGGKPYADDMLAARAALRALVAELLATTPEHVSLTSSTTDGCNIVLGGLGLQSKEEIVTTDAEHFGLAGPVFASGATVRVARVQELGPEEALEAIVAE